MAFISDFAPTRRLADLVADIAPARRGFDPLGIAAGMRAYRIYATLDAKSDAELAELGLARTDAPRAAAGMAFGEQAA